LIDLPSVEAKFYAVELLIERLELEQALTERANDPRVH
jgi:hypothetical protein